ncbi:DUF1829 domain-containing protein [Treponema zuelzerae]|uniref:DUF1829 domain-containing protein n=1 Tax=Teretinema zuelzerae TaxID=156 RepID=A0AAE3JHW6_9SPIR|nr:DUF1829 domain-containing protein [Teretinema zuelzerae]MCD1653518.1 DUF1829 domain-containing protein [Teretinema zuelzerae]
MINNLLDNYQIWLKDNFIVNDNEIITPFTDSHNDLIHFRIDTSADTMVITDDGYTVSNLNISGFNFTESRQYLFESILKINGLFVDDHDALKMILRNESVGIQMHNYINALKEIGNLLVLSQQNIRNYFREDVEHFFQEKNIPFSKNVRRKGKSGLDHYFDFQLDKTPMKPERIIRVIGSTDTKSVQSLLFSWNDINIRNDLQLVTFINDKLRPLSDKMEKAFNQYNVIPVEWKKRELALNILSA